MANERDQASIDQGLKKVNCRVITAAETLSPSDRRIECDSTAGIFTVTLPDVAAAQGNIISIYMTVDNGDVTITQTGAMGWDGDYTLNDVGDGYALYSDGKSWFPFTALA
uniref:Uncharacterized protein n=1 Tax=viral metagenome TaxID=1070528 RepID=A0A6M3JA35_9ZZZZ